MSITRLAAEYAWLPQGWEAAVDLGIADGRFVRVRPGEAPDEAVPLGRWVLPGMVNLHSHAFQRAMAGLAERRSGGGAQEDSFWTWREVMYAFAGRVGPDELRAIAAQLYVEMLEAGYTQVCEFHYLHHQPGGQPYADELTMAWALVEAAQEVGIAPEFVALALAEQPAPNAPAVAVTGTRQDRLTTRLLGTSASLAVGEPADLCIFDPRATWKVDRGTLASQGKNTPFLGAELAGRVRCTLVDGQVVHEA